MMKLALSQNGWYDVIRFLSFNSTCRQQHFRISHETVEGYKIVTECSMTKIKILAYLGAASQY